MKLRRKYAWLLTAPVAWMTGCGVGPISGLADREPVISLEQPDPLVSLRRSTLVESEGADAGAFTTAKWRASADTPEEKRLILLTGSRRRMRTQMMMGLQMPLMQAPLHQGAAKTGAPTQSAAKTGAKPASGAASAPAVDPSQMLLNPMLLQSLLDPSLMPQGGLAGRRAARAQRGATTKEETAASTEADRIERAAEAEAERAEKAAIAEATLAERRLLAEAELVERMTRAELELAERLAAAKDERDRRIEMAREERELRMAILGIDASELESNPVDEALSRMAGERKSRGESSLTRLTRFFRGRSEPDETATVSAPRQSSRRIVEEDQADAIARSRGSENDSLLDRTLQHSDELLNRPSIAEFASSIPEDAPPIVRRDGGNTDDRTPPESLHPSLRDDFDSRLADDNVEDRGERPAEDWSLLDNFLESPDVAAAETGEAERSRARAFPNEIAEPDRTASVASANDAGPSERPSPEDDIWILGERPADDDALAQTEADSSPYTAESFTEPGGLFADADFEPASDAIQTRQAPLAAVTSPARPFPSAEPGHSHGEAASESAPAGDPWLESSALVAEAAPAVTESPLFDWSQSASAAIDPVIHQQPPAVEQTVRPAAWTSQSLRDVCGPLPADLEALVLQLDIPEAGVRKAVLGDLAKLGAKARPAVPAIRVLLDDSPLVAAHAAWTLWEIERNEPQIVREMVRLLQTGHPEVVQFTAYALGSLGPKALDAAPALRVERERFNGATRVHVAEALTRIDAFDQASVEVLIYSLNHPDTHVRWISALALGQVQVRYADLVVPALVAALHDADAEVRSAAALSIGGFGAAGASAIPELQSRATLDCPSVREAAQTALACIQK